MKLKIEDHQQITILTICGELTSEYTDQFRREMIERFDGHIHDFIVQLNEIESIDSKGIEALLWLEEQTQEQLGQMRLACATDDFKTIMKMVRLESQFDFHDDIESAIMSLQE